MAILPKAISRFNTTFIKKLMNFFKELEQIILRFIWNHKKKKKKKQNCQKNPEVWGGENKAISITLSGFRLYYKAILIKQHGIGSKTDL